MTVRRDRFPKGYSSGFATNCESQESGSSGRVDTEIMASQDSSFLKRKCMNLNFASRDSFVVPVQVLSLSKLSPSERKNLQKQLRADLERTQVLQKKVEMQRPNAMTVSSSSDIISCNNPKNQTPVGNTRKSSAFMPGPGKKIDTPDLKARTLNRDTSGRFESVIQGSTPSTSNAALMKQCDNLLKKLMTHQFGNIFNTPVDVVKYNIPDYLTIIKHPMDLGTIKRKIASCEYASPMEFLADVRLTFSNAMTYNPPGNQFHLMADTLSKFFEVRWKVIEKKIPVHVPQRLPEQSGLREEKETNKPAPPSKKRKLTPTQPIVTAEPFKRKMTNEDRRKVGRDLEDALSELPDNVIEFLKKHSSNGKDAEEDEIEIDIDDFSDEDLFTLRELLDAHLQEKRKNSTKAEPCEIELLNESGVSNSSMQLYRGNDLADEEVDIGGNEPPLSNYPPVEIEKDKGYIGKRRANSGSMGGNSDSDSSSSESETECANASTPRRLVKENSGPGADLGEKDDAVDLADNNQSISGLDQLEQTPQQKPNSAESDCHQYGESTSTERQVSPGKLYRAALLKSRFADTILRAREKALNQVEKGDPEKLRREREELEMRKREDRARIQAEAKAAEDARRQAEAEAANEARRQRELEREAARQALLKIEKTVEINENSRFLEDLEMLRTVVPPEQLPSSVDETSPEHSQDGLGSFKFGASNPLEQLGLYMKNDEEEEEGEPPHCQDVEEGEID